MASNSILANMAVALTANVSDFQRGMANARKELAGFKKAGEEMKGFGEGMSKWVSAPLAGLAGVSLKVAGDLQALKKGLTAVAGSAEAADKQFNSLKEVAKLPGLGLEEAVQGSINLQAAGFSAKQAEGALKGFGNALATVGKGKAELDGVITALSQMAAKGKISAEEINQIAERVPQIRKVMKDAFGTSNTEELQKMGISATQFVDLVTVELNKLPPVAGGLKNSFENLADSSKLALANLGDAINKNLNVEGLLNKVSGWITSLAEGFNQLSPGVQKFIVISGAVVAAVGPMLVIFGAILTAIPSMVAGYAALKIGLIALKGGFVAATKSAIAFLAANAPIIATVAGIAAAVAGLALIAKSIYDSWDTVSAFFVRLWSEIKLTFANGLLAIIKSVNAVGSKIGIEFKDTEKSLQNFANSAKKNLDATPYVSLSETVGTVGQAMSNNLTEGMAKVKSLFFGGGKAASEGATAIATAGDKTVTSFNKQGTAADALKAKWEALKGTALALAEVRLGDKFGGENGLNGTNKSNILMNETQSANKFQSGSEMAPNKVDPIADLQEKVVIAKDILAEFATTANQMIAGAIGDSFVALGNVIAQSVTGGDMKGALNGFLMVLLDFCGQFGQALIAAGIAAAGLGELIKTGPYGAPLAIAAGVALVALAGVAKGLLSKGPSFGGGAPSAPSSSSPSYGSPGTSKGYGDGKVVFEIAGDKLQGVLTRREYKAARFGG